MSDLVLLGYISGLLAVVLSFLFVLRALRFKNWIEFYLGTAQLFWLTGNAIWMWGELTDSKYANVNEYPDYKPIYPDLSKVAGIILAVDMGFVGIYFMFLMPLGLFPHVSERIRDLYDESKSCVPRQPLKLLFKSWRSYENVHIFFWLGKDCAWVYCSNAGNYDYYPSPVFWLAFTVPTLLIGLDFVLTSSQSFQLIDHIHYIFQFNWIVANLLSGSFGSV